MKLLEMNLRFTILVFMLYIFVCAYGKELQLRGTHALFKRNLHRQKRLSDFSEERNDVCSENLKMTPKKPSIIKSSASIDNGARYINAKNGTTKVECFNMCCRDPECDTSLYQDKEKRRCYMFDCHEKCVFKEHAGYAITVLYRPKITPPPKEEEEELAQLHDDEGDKSGTSSSSHDDDINYSDNEDRSNSDSGSSSSSSDGGSSSRPNDENDNRRMGPSARAHASKHVYVAPHTAGLSDNCESDVSCEDPNAGCFGQACHCKEGFYNKNGLCRKMCTQSDFECLALGTSGRGPECIPKSNMCDSVLQCADGSDEFNCPSQDEQSSHQLPSSGIIKNKGTYQPGTKSSMREEIPSGIHKTESTVSSEKEEDTKASLTSIPKTDAPAPTSNQDSSSGESVKNKTKQNNEVGSVSISKTNLTHPSTKKPHPSHDHINSKVFVTKEKVIIASSTSEAEGPIIALSLGLAFTLILVALLGCRLRNMKHRLRKGRPLNSNEADYLINGMYL